MTEMLHEMMEPLGLFVRGGFHPRPADAVPELADGTPVGTVLLIGNAGTAMWAAFSRERHPAARHPLDDWLRPGIEAAAAAAGAEAVFPNDGPPFVPVQEWAMRAEPVHRSPLGILIHPDFGLWHVYRAALLFAQRLRLSPRADRASPCDTCRERPCLSVCPADAFLPDRFDAKACTAHVESEAGRVCREKGCLARRACPVGRDYLYDRDQQEFHTTAMLRAVRQGYGLKS